MKFQNPSMHGSEVILCIKKDAQTDGRTDARTHKRPRSNMPSNFFEVGGIMKLEL